MEIKEKREVLCLSHTRLLVPDQNVFTSVYLTSGRQLARDRENAFPGRASTVRLVGALSDLDNISVRIADVAACLAVLGDRLREELRSSTFP